MTKLNVNIKRLHDDAVIPRYATEGSAGFDLVAIDDVIIEPGETKLIRTGLAFEIPAGYELQIRPRSGVTLKTKLRVQLGTVDSDYRGEVGVIVDNVAIRHTKYASDYSITYDHIDGTKSGVPKRVKEDKFHGDYVEYNKVPNRTYLIRKGDRIAQGVINATPQAVFNVVDELNDTERGHGGFGSTGVKEDNE